MRGGGGPPLLARKGVPLPRTPLLPQRALQGHTMRQMKEVNILGIDTIPFYWDVVKRMSGMFFDFKRCGNFVP